MSVLHHRIHHLGPRAEWVVLVHGAGGSSSIWFRQIRAYAREFNVLLVDLRGHGESAAGAERREGKRYTFVSLRFDEGIQDYPTYRVYRDSMTDSDGKEVTLDNVPAFDRQDVEFVGAIREGREPESSAASVLPTMVLLDKADKAMREGVNP